MTSIPAEMNGPALGKGIYTVADVARILKIPYYKALRTLKDYWNKRLAAHSLEDYSWTKGKSHTIGFHTLVEFYTYFQLREQGVPTPQILQAHYDLAQRFGTTYPFAKASILDGLMCNCKRIVLDNEGDLLDLKLSGLCNLRFIKPFLQKLDFDNNELAERLWPLGKDVEVVTDPDHQFGQPTISGTNISPIAIYRMHQANEPSSFIAATYRITEKQVKDAIKYCKQAA